MIDRMDILDAGQSVAPSDPESSLLELGGLTALHCLLRKARQSRGQLLVPAPIFALEIDEIAFNPSTTIRYGLPQRSHVTLNVFNTLGQQVATLVQGEQEAGYHEAVFDASGLASGVYLYRLQAGDFVQAKKLIVVK